MARAKGIWGGRGWVCILGEPGCSVCGVLRMSRLGGDKKFEERRIASSKMGFDVWGDFLSARWNMEDWELNEDVLVGFEPLW